MMGLSPVNTVMFVFMATCGVLAALILLCGRMGWKVPGIKRVPAIVTLALWPIMVIGVSFDVLAAVILVVTGVMSLGR